MIDVKKLREITYLMRSKRGAVSVIAAIAFTAILLMTGVVVDLGRSYVEASSLQSAADAASLAASYLLPVGIDDITAISAVETKAIEYVAKNGKDASQVRSISLGQPVSGKYTTVSVELHGEVEYLFGQIAGITHGEINKRATTRVESVISASGTVPLGIPEDSYLTALANNTTDNLTVKYGAPDGEEGFYGALDLDGVKGGGANDYSTWLSFGYYGEISVNDNIFTEPGNMTGPTATSFAERFNSCTHFPGQGGCTTEHFENECARVVNLIIYQDIGKGELKVTGFAPFILDGISPEGYITASKIDLQINEGSTTELDETTIKFGLFKSRLIE